MLRYSSNLSLYITKLSLLKTCSWACCLVREKHLLVEFLATYLNVLLEHTEISEQGWDWDGGRSLACSLAHYLISPSPPSPTHAYMRRDNTQPWKGACSSLRKSSNEAAGTAVLALCGSTSRPAWTQKSTKNAVSPQGSLADSLPALKADVTTTASFYFLYREGKGGVGGETHL